MALIILLIFIIIIVGITLACLLCINYNTTIGGDKGGDIATRDDTMVMGDNTDMSGNIDMGDNIDNNTIVGGKTNDLKEVDILTNNAINHNKKILSKFNKVVDIHKIFSKDNLNMKYKDKFFKGIYPDYIFPVNLIQIKNGKAEEIKTDFSISYDDSKDNRISHTIKMINYSMEMYGPIKDTYVIYWMHDREAYELLNSNFPLFVNCIANCKMQLIMPDITFVDISFKNKYGTEEVYDWDASKKLINEYQPTERIHKIYFKGANTGQKRHKIREYFNRYQKNSKMLIKLDAWNDYEPMYMWKKYDALLNLPGHYDWSNRFKYLFLMDNLVINVNPIINDDGEFQKRSKTFIDFYVKPNVHYYDVDVKCKYIEMPGAETYNRNASLKAIKEINNIKLEEYEDMVQNGKKLIQDLELKHVYKYIHATISEIADKFEFIL